MRMHHNPSSTTHNENYALHANTQPAPTTEREVFLNIFDYIDRLFNMVRPRRLLYMAIGARVLHLFGIVTRMTGAERVACGFYSVYFQT
jgi:hypothetical protein